ncbi:MAG: RCC1 domain-containing protein [Acholeplasmataceae bacterium]
MKNIYISLLIFLSIITIVSCVPREVSENLEVDDSKQLASQLLVSGNNFIAYLDNNQELWMWGDNTSYQLNIDGVSKSIPYNITDTIEFEEDEYIIHMDAGYAHMGILTSVGNVWMWGNNAYGQLGFEGEEKAMSTTINQYLPLEEDECIIDIKLGGFHTGLLTSHNRLILFGSNTSGQLGNHTVSITGKPHSLEFDHEINSYDLGADHSIVISNQRLFVWGSQFNGQLGLGDVLNQHNPVELSYAFDGQPSHVFLGTGNTYVVTSEGHVYGFGKSVYGLLGSNTDVDIYTPILVTENLDASFPVSITLGYGHAIMISEENVLGIGSNTLGQLPNVTKMYVNQFQQLYVDTNIVHVATGGHYSVFVDEEQSFWIYGYSDTIQIGHIQLPL